MAVLLNRTYEVGSISAAVLAGTLLTSAFLLSQEADLRLAVPLLIGATAAMTTSLAGALYFGERGRLALSPVTILIVALLLRLMFLFAPPQLSDDIYRYLWDGSNLIGGTNPYQAPPSALAPLPGQKAIHSRINHPQYVTIYPPMAQIIFAGGAASGGTVTGLKGFLVLIDMGLCAMIILLLKKFEMPVWRAVLYAWNPLPVVEIAGSGHVDSAGMAFVLVALYLLLCDKKTQITSSPYRWPALFSGVLMACAGLVKLVPFLFVPLLWYLVPKGRRRYFISGCSGMMMLLVVPFLPDLLNMISSLDTYATHWEFAGFAFNLLRTVTGSGTLARQLLAASFIILCCIATYRLAQQLKQAGTPDSKGFQTLKICYIIAMAFLLFTPTLQPWYALTLAVFLPFCAGPAGLVLCWAVFLTYQVQIPYFILGQWHEDPYVTAAVFMAPASASFLSIIFSNIFPRDTSGHRQ